MVEINFQCPSCWEYISMLVDTSVAHQSYVEDCEVCCRPLQLELNTSPGNVETINVMLAQ